MIASDKNYLFVKARNEGAAGMTVAGHPVFFGGCEYRQDAASVKTSMQWHTIRVFNFDNG